MCNFNKQYAFKKGLPKLGIYGTLRLKSEVDIATQNRLKSKICVYLQ